MGLLNELPTPPVGKKGWPWTEETNTDIYVKGMQYPKIGIVTPSYKQGQYIEETIRSILLQNYPNLEYIIIDGGSKDNTVEIIKKYEPWISFWVSEKDNGQSHAINKGLQRSSGEIVNWINSDDYLEMNALHAIAAKYLEPGLKAGIIEGRMNYFGVNKDNFVFGTNEGKPLEEILPGMPSPQPAAFFLKKYYTDCGGVNESYSYAMDYDLYTRIMLQSGIAYIKDTIANFRLHHEGKSLAKGDRFLDEQRVIFFSICKEYNLTDVIKHLKASGELSATTETVSQVMWNMVPVVQFNQEYLSINYLASTAERYFNNNEFVKCKRNLGYLKKTFKEEDLAGVNAYRQMSFKTRFPVPVILVIKKLKAAKRKLYSLFGK